MRFYQENNVNPLSGCLPLIVQMPVLFALFQVLRNIQDHIPTSGAFNDLFVDLCGNLSPSACSPKDVMFLGMDLTVAPSQATGGFISRLPYFIAVAAVVASGWYQMWQTQARQRRMGSGQNNPINKQMQMISRVFPIFFGWFAWIAASGLVVYFVTSSLWRIGQQHLVLNKYYEQHPDERAGGSKKAGSKAGSSKAGSSKAGPANEGGGKDASLPPGKSAPPSAAPNGSTGDGVQDNGAGARTRPSQHTSRKKRKRRR
jgi:YidC/Oxa1 family membrane protein insertase